MATTVMAASFSLLSGTAHAATPEPTVNQILAAHGATVGTDTFQVSTQTFSFASGTDPYGFYIDNEYVNPNGVKYGGTWYTQTGLNSDNLQHVDVFQQQGTNNSFLAFEDRAFPSPTADFNDLVVEFNTSTDVVTKLAAYAGAAPDTTFGYYDSVTGVKTPIWTDSVADGTSVNLSPVPEASTLVGFGFGGLALAAGMIRGRKKAGAA